MVRHHGDHVGVRVNVRRSATIPDHTRMRRYRAAPQHGPRLLFFSGGSALNPLARALTAYTHNAIHLTTAFDSGGSSGRLRGPFQILSVGDLRSRLMAVADAAVADHSNVFDLFAHRLPKEASQSDLRTQLDRLAAGEHELLASIESPLRPLIAGHLRQFQRHMPADFDLRGASIGNLVLVGGYVGSGQGFESVLFLFSKLVEARATVRPIVTDHLHLAARLADGSLVVGQHRLTGKEVAPISCRIEDIFLVGGLDDTSPGHTKIAPATAALIAQAELICFPMGSFYSSVVANLLPEGVGRAIARNVCPKVYIPNTARDPEQVGMTLAECVEALLRFTRRSGAGDAPGHELLNYVLVDPRVDAYEVEVDATALRALGAEVITTPLITEESRPYVDENLAIQALLSLV